MNLSEKKRRRRGSTMLESAVAMSMLGISGFTLVVLLTTLGVNNLKSHISSGANAEVTNFLNTSLVKGEPISQIGVTALGVSWSTTILEVDDALVEGVYQNTGQFNDGDTASTVSVIVFSPDDQNP